MCSIPGCRGLGERHGWQCGGRWHTDHDLPHWQDHRPVLLPAGRHRRLDYPLPGDGGLCDDGPGEPAARPGEGAASFLDPSTLSATGRFHFDGCHEAQVQDPEVFPFRVHHPVRPPWVRRMNSGWGTGTKEPSVRRKENLLNGRACRVLYTASRVTGAICLLRRAVASRHPGPCPYPRLLRTSISTPVGNQNQTPLGEMALTLDPACAYWKLSGGGYV